MFFPNRGGTTKRVLIWQSKRGVQKHTQSVKQHHRRPAADRKSCLQIHRGFSLKSFFSIGFKRAEHFSRFLSSERKICFFSFLSSPFLSYFSEREREREKQKQRQRERDPQNTRKQTKAEEQAERLAEVNRSRGRGRDTLTKKTAT